jgi:hypothetical protein
LIATLGYAVSMKDAVQTHGTFMRWSARKLAAQDFAPTPFAAKGEPCPRNNNTPIDNFSAMNWSCCAASASLVAAPRCACRFFDVPGSLACQLAAI